MSLHTPIPLIRIAHLSDLHCSHPNWDPRQLLSKRWIGNLNILFSRRYHFDPSGITTLIPLFKQQGVNVVAITGDLSSTSHPAEFKMAQELIHPFIQEGFKVFTLPGNHDHYTKQAEKDQLFYQFFPSHYDQDRTYSLKEDKLSSTYLGNSWWIIGLDTAYASCLLSSNGNFSSEIEHTLTRALTQIPSHHSVILLNHFSLFANTSKRKLLIGYQALQALLKKFPCVKLFLSGHTHQHSIADLRASHLPIISDAGSTGIKKGGSWNLIEIYKDKCAIQAFKRSDDSGDILWKPFASHQFQWSLNETLV